MDNINYTINNDVITVFDEDFVPVTIDASHPNHSLVREALEWEGSEFTHTLDDILDLMKPITKVATAVKGTRITVTDDQVLFDGQPLHGTIVERILAGNRVDNLVKFLDKLMDNPSHRAVNQLYGFLEANNHAITADGDFVAYKIVRADYRDLYSGRFDNSPGTTVSVPRNAVDEDPDRTCSSGLHVCGFYYLDHYGSVRNGTDRVVSVVINPKDVVAVPRDYNNAKMRVSSYTVLEDITDKVKDKVGTIVGLDHPLSYEDYYDDRQDMDESSREYQDWATEYYDYAPEDDWIEHDGSGFPYWDLDRDDLIDIKFRDGGTVEDTTAGSWKWGSDQGMSTIVAYRIS
jgi:hypothetical protein